MAVDIPVRPSPERVELLRRLGEAHQEWADRHLASAPFHPGGRVAGSDYNQHYLDLEASGEQLDELAATTAALLSRRGD